MNDLALTSIEYDPIGHLRLHIGPESDLNNLTRRIGSTATLDGGRDFDDRGFTHADRTFTVVDPTAVEPMHERAVYLIRVHPILRVTTAEGVFRGSIDRVDYRNGALSVRILIREKEA